MIQETIDLCKKGAELNYSVESREGNVIYLSGSGDVVATGDLHGNRRNFEKITSFANLGDNKDRHVVLQEILHGGGEDEFGGCMSFQLFFDAISYQLEFPGRVHLILGNHDTAIISDSCVLKSGKEMNTALKTAMKRCFGDGYEQVNDALKSYLLSQPLAVKSQNKIWISHSLPADRTIKQFDIGILEKKIEPSDMLRGSSAYSLTWGRKQSEQTIAAAAKLFDVEFFILGHQPQPTGWKRMGDNVVILASDHSHGHIILFDLSRPCTIEELTNCVVPLASVI